MVKVHVTLPLLLITVEQLHMLHFPANEMFILYKISIMDRKLTF